MSSLQNLSKAIALIEKLVEESPSIQQDTKGFLVISYHSPLSMQEKRAIREILSHAARQDGLSLAGYKARGRGLVMHFSTKRG